MIVVEWVCVGGGDGWFWIANGVFLSKDFYCNDEDEADGTEEDDWAMDGGWDVVEGRHDEVENLVEIEQGEKDCSVC